ncbi:MAG: hypothetical protein AAF911_01990 [Planctomycetota bacterium]
MARLFARIRGVIIARRFRRPKQRRPDRRQLLFDAVFVLVRRFGHPPRHAVHAHTQQRLRRLPPRFHRHLVVQRQPRQPVHRVHPQPRQRQRRLHVRQHPHPRHRSPGVKRRRPRRDVRRRHLQPLRRLRHVFHPTQHHPQQRRVPCPIRFR